jgi:UDP-N-acetylglucosamine:LPS N-acetylglucosamine transferase
MQLNIKSLFLFLEILRVKYSLVRTKSNEVFVCISSYTKIFPSILAIFLELFVIIAHRQLMLENLLKTLVVKFT